MFSAPTDLRILFALVLLPGPGVEKPHQKEPDREVKNGAAQKPATGEIALLELRERFLFQVIGIEPGAVESLHAQNDGDEHDENEPDVARRGFERPPNDDAPVAAGEVLKHKQSQGADGQTEDQHVAEEIRMIELLGRAEGAGNGKKQRDSADKQSGSLNAVDASGRLVILRVHFVASPDISFSFKAGGNSETGALRLNCSARK